MKSFLSNRALVSSFFILPLLMACSSKEPDPDAAIANPASEHCVQKGGKLEIVKDASGEKGMCHLPDGSVVEEWELFRRDTPQT
ncbi:MAG: DUF333 domain-containing protein [Desulfobulbus oligotrophicus]|jgi:putative hemolysin|nr:DUF333 domain-containing protein [Desulfobulbus oligotrophicus]